MVMEYDKQDILLITGKFELQQKCKQYENGHKQILKFKNGRRGIYNISP